jgi:vacuolar-type H+-ATPase subunit E/Vma4|tara:strand:- start:1105 stop:1371 length:267 start_codon:yes stop_codon:yes gene_type:complete
MTDARLKRMEDKLDTLSEAIVQMARMEERMISLFKRLDRVDETFNKLDQRMDQLEQTSIKRGQTIAFAERLFWIVMTGAVGLIFVYLR